MSSNLTQEEKNSLESVGALERERVKSMYVLSEEIILVVSSTKLYLVSVVYEEDKYMTFLKQTPPLPVIEISGSFKIENPTKCPNIIF
jgi:hypothetical protein